MCVREMQMRRTPLRRSMSALEHLALSGQRSRLVSYGQKRKCGITGTRPDQLFRWGIPDLLRQKP